MKILPLILFFLIGCAKEQAVHPPAGADSQQKDINVSRERARNLNKMERRQIEKWISQQQEKFYPMPLNYWVNMENLDKRQRKSDDATVSYMFDIYDFYGTKIYQQPKGFREVSFAKFPNDLKAVEDALRYMKTGEEATLLIPSVLGYGTYGDGDKIGNDLPIIIKLKMIQ